MNTIALLGMGGTAGPGTGYGPGMGQGWLGMGQFMGFPGGGLVLILVLVLAVYLVVRVTRAGSRPEERQGPAPETPLDVLKRRYAAGEIDRETFERIKEDIEDK